MFLVICSDLMIKKNTFKHVDFLIVFTCVPKRNHESETEDDVDSKTTGHLNVRPLLPVFVFAD